MFPLTILILGAVAASNILLGFVVYFSKTKSYTRRYFLLLTIAITAYTVLEYIAYQTTDPAVALWILRVMMCFAVPFAMYFYLLARSFPSDEIFISKKEQYFVYGLGIAVMLMTLSPLVFQSVSINSLTHSPDPLPGPGMPIFGIAVSLFDLAGLWVIGRKAITAAKGMRQSFMYFFIGALMMKALILIFNFIYPVFLQNTKFIPYSITFSLPFVILMSYAIVRHHLLNIKVIAAEAMTFLLALVTLIQLLTAEGFAEYIFQVSLFILFLSFGVLLIRSVRKEVEQKEELTKLSEALTKANAELKQINEAKTEFLSVASHQLRTPLTAIKGYSSMLLEGDYGELNVEQHKSASLIFESSQRLSVLVADLLDMSRIESGRMEFDFAGVNLCKVVESVMDELAPKAKNKKLYLLFDNVNRVCPEIRADEEKLRQIVINLIDNAIKYTVQGGVTCRLMRTGNELHLSITDTGIGIALEDQPRMYEKFFRADSASKLTREGTGLGIYVVKKMTEAHGGKVWFESKGEGKGTTFFVSFPIPQTSIKEERVRINSLEAL